MEEILEKNVLNHLSLFWILYSEAAARQAGTKFIPDIGILKRGGDFMETSKEQEILQKQIKTVEAMNEAEENKKYWRYLLNSYHGQRLDSLSQDFFIFQVDKIYPNAPQSFQTELSFEELKAEQYEIKQKLKRLEQYERNQNAQGSSQKPETVRSFFASSS